jgi:hypothetical protein
MSRQERKINEAYRQEMHTLLLSLIGLTVVDARIGELGPQGSVEDCVVTFSDGRTIRFEGYGLDEWGLAVYEVELPNPYDIDAPFDEETP